MELITKSAKETFEFGKKTGSSLAERPPMSRYGKVLALTGNLGSGKTTFVQGLASGLGVKSRIISPTFIIMRSYGNFHHIDLYRLEGNIDQELINLGIADLWKDDKNVVAIEWAEKAAEFLPKNSAWIRFENTNNNTRKIICDL